LVVLARQATQAGGIDSSESIPGLLNRLKIRALPYDFSYIRLSMAKVLQCRTYTFSQLFVQNVFNAGGSTLSPILWYNAVQNKSKQFRNLSCQLLCNEIVTEISGKSFIAPDPYPIHKKLNFYMKHVLQAGNRIHNTVQNSERPNTKVTAGNILNISYYDILVKWARNTNSAAVQ
jgi:hypothetical protein